MSLWKVRAMNMDRNDWPNYLREKMFLVEMPDDPSLFEEGSAATAKFEAEHDHHVVSSIWIATCLNVNIGPRCEGDLRIVQITEGLEEVLCGFHEQAWVSYRASRTTV